ncbi:MAG: ABC transporter ATP-binding protein, partial [Actinomadura rubrobrunea]|nr:ABC transporter ATP-binding protein [Actinomadura rubrobrunea]
LATAPPRGARGAPPPPGGLDVTVQAQILDVLRVAREATGAAVLLITHDLGVVAGAADRVMVMYAGRAVETAPVDQLYHRPRMPYTIGLLKSLPRADGAVRPVPIDGAPPSASDPPPGCPFAPRCPVSLARCGDALPEPVPVGPGGHRAACVNLEATADLDAVFPLRTAARAPEPAPRHLRPVVLKVEDLVRHYPQRHDEAVHAVDGVTFDIRAGETLGLAGESGCGKTTVLMEILRLARPQRGRITVLGEDTATLTAADRKRLRRDLQVVFQDPFSSLDPRMRVADILAEPLAAHGTPKAKIPLRVQELLGMVGLEKEHASRYPRGLSGGQAQRVGIARALALEPRLLLLDEPVAALDVSVQAGILELLDELRARLDLSYLVVAHDLAVLRHVADRLAVMYNGRLVEIGDADAIYERPVHPYTRALLDAVPQP